MPKKLTAFGATFFWYMFLPFTLCFAQDGENYTFTGEIGPSGGFFDSIIAGSAVGTFFGHDFTGFGILDMAVAAIALYVMFKLILFYGLSSHDESHHQLDTSQLPDEDDPKKNIKMQALNAWARLRSESTSEDENSLQTQSHLAYGRKQKTTLENFDREDFLDGAKLLYTCLQKAWAARNLGQLQDFITPEMLDVLTAHAKKHPQTTTVDVVLVTPTLIDITTNQNSPTDDVTSTKWSAKGSGEFGEAGVALKKQKNKRTEGNWNTANTRKDEINGPGDTGYTDSPGYPGYPGDTNQTSLHAKVLFTALISEGDAEHPTETKEIWYFVFDPSRQNTWQLDGIEPVTSNTV